MSKLTFRVMISEDDILESKLPGRRNTFSITIPNFYFNDFGVGSWVHLWMPDEGLVGRGKVISKIPDENDPEFQIEIDLLLSSSIPLEVLEEEYAAVHCCRSGDILCEEDARVENLALNVARCARDF